MRKASERELGASGQSDDANGADSNGTQSDSPHNETPTSRLSGKPSGSTRKAVPPSRPSASSSPRQFHNSADAAREIEGLKTKLKVMENKRAEDRERMRDLETLKAERDKFEGIIQKLQAKYQPQQIELGDLRKLLKEKETKLEELERQQAENDSILEMAALDRDMAEEMADGFKHEGATLRQKVEELQLEVEVLQQENEELGQTMSPEERASQGWLQMEKTNERLREALIRLRDMTEQQEKELKDQIKELEQDLEDYSAVKTQYESTKEKLLASENNMEDLKQQLETALGAEEMIEDLADKNMRYQEQINELRAAIEDLEALKEINDELEFNHVETEKQMQEEIDYRESVFNEQCRRITQQDETIEDLEYTLVRFRELVTNLQGGLEDMRASKQITDTESNELTSRSRAMMDLNTKLQASMSKAQTKTIDVELGHMEAGEAAEHLSILKLYLPEYFDGERNSILAFLRFKRIGFKTTLMNSAIRERLSDQTSISTTAEEFFTAHDSIGKLLWISSICDRFVNYISGCPAEKFHEVEGAYYELEPVERTLNSWIETLKTNEFNARKCVDELQRSSGVLGHLAETLLPSNLETFTDEMCMHSILTQAFLENAASATSYMKSLIQSNLGPPTEDDEERAFFFNKMDAFVTQARGLKVAVGKIHRLFEDLKSRSLAPPNEAGEPCQQIEDVAENLSDLVRQLGENIVLLVGEEGRVEPFTLTEMLKNMSQTSASFARASGFGTDGDDTMSLLSDRLRKLGGFLEGLDSISSDLSRTAEFERLPAPWIARARELKSAKTMSPDADEAMQRLRNEVHEAFTALGVKDKTLEEQAIKVELLETRMREASKKASMVQELESRIEEQRAKELDLSGTVEKQQKDLQVLENEREDYKARLEKMKRASGTTGVATTADGVVVDSTMSLATMRENEALRSEVQSLQAAVRYFREENRRSSLLDPYSLQRSTDMYSWLNTPLTQKTTSARQESAQQTALETRDVFDHLLKLTKASRVCDLKPAVSQGKNNNKNNNDNDNDNNANINRASWRPSKTKLRYQVLQQREDFERWAEWRNDIVAREREQDRLAAAAAQSSKFSIPNLQQFKTNSGDLYSGPGNFQSAPGLGQGMINRAWQMLSKDQGEKAAAGGVEVVEAE